MTRDGAGSVSRRTFALSAGLGLGSAAAFSPSANAGQGGVSVDDLVAGRASGPDGARLQAAVDEAIRRDVRRLVIPPKAGGYLLTAPIVVPPAGGGLEILGAGPAGELRCEAGDAGIVVQAHRVGLSDIHLAGRGRFFKQTGVVFRKSRNPDDVDASVQNCQFSDFGAGVSFEGRGLRFSDNRIGSCETGVRLDWPEDVSETDPVLQRLPYGYRKITLFRNYGHNVSVMFRNVSSHPIVGAQISDNHVDVGRAFWFGPISHSIIGPNIARNCKRIPIFIVGKCAGVRISGIYGGLPEPAAGREAVHQPSLGLYFKGEVRSLTLDVSLTDLGRAGVVFAGNVEGADVRIAYDAAAAMRGDRFVRFRGDADNVFMKLIFPKTMNGSMGVAVDGELTGGDLALLARSGRGVDAKEEK